MGYCFVFICEDPAAFEDEINSQLFPGQFIGVTFLQNLNAFAIHDKGVSLSFDFSIEATMYGIVLQQMCKSLCISDVINSHKVEFRLL